MSTSTFGEAWEAYERHGLHVETLNADVADVIIRLEQERDRAFQDAENYRTAAEVARRSAERLDRLNDELVAEHETMRHQLSEARVSAQAANNAMYHAIRRERETDADLRRCAESHQRALDAVETLRAELLELTQLVGAETPIGAATLAQTWYAMQSALMGEIAKLRAERIELRRAGADIVMEAHELYGLAAALDASIHGDGNGRCWCGAKEADRLRGFLERHDGRM